MAVNDTLGGNVPYFSETPAWVLACAQEIAGGPVFKGQMTDHGPALSCYASPVTALIDMALYRRPGLRYQLVSASTVPREYFMRQDRQGLIANLHFGWPVVDRRIVCAEDGTPGSASMLVKQTVAGAARLEVDADGVALLDVIHECAGLFAWREACEASLSWNVDRMHKAVHAAVNSIGFAVADPARSPRIALFDLEAMEWHLIDRWLGAGCL